MNEIIIIISLILLNGIFAMSEIALISARKSSLNTDAKKGSKAAKLALKLANEPDRFLSTIQIGITLIGILTGIYSGAALTDDFSVILKNWGVSPLYASLIAQGLIVVAVTYLTLIFGELVPKRIGLSIAEKASKVVARPMYILSLVAAPFVWLLSKSTSCMFNLLGIKDSDNKVTEEDIKSIVQEGKEGGEVQEVEQDIVERVFILGDLKVSSIMTQRNEIIWLDLDMDKKQVKKTIEQDLYEMYPVTGKKKGDVEGVIFLKDLVLHLDTPDFNLECIVRPAFYFHENMSVYKVLEEMKEQVAYFKGEDKLIEAQRIAERTNFDERTGNKPRPDMRRIRYVSGNYNTQGYSGSLVRHHQRYTEGTGDYPTEQQRRLVGRRTVFFL